jgi:hypothetical protein
MNIGVAEIIPDDLLRGLRLGCDGLVRRVLSC